MTILPFDTTDATIANAGGKGANLARLTRVGFPVPTGFIISTEAYITFVEANQLGGSIHSVLANIRPDDAGALESASAAIRAKFTRGKIPAEIEADIRSAYAALSEVPVAVRSSATAEDLPDLSFAGQQDTYLNVIGEEQLLGAVIACWGSLWTGRAIGYRIRNGISHEDASLAVIVQRLVQSEVSGVLFTANPLTGLLSETVIDATFGLGEALVSGQVEPDQYIVDSLSGEIKTRSIGSKSVSTRSIPGGGVETRPEDTSSVQTLSADQIQQLISLGKRVQAEYGTPQDIEWAFAGGNLYLLQSRPITSLFPVPEVSFDPLIIWFSFAAVQGLVGPMTPLGLNGAQHVVAGAGRMFHLHLKPEEVNVFAPAGLRLWVRISDLIRNPIGNRIFSGALGLIEPSVEQIVRSLAAEPRLGAGQGRLKFSTLRRLAYFFLPVLFRMLRIALRPEKARRDFDAKIDAYLATAQITPAADPYDNLANTLVFMRTQLATVFSYLLPQFIPVFGPSMGALTLLNKIAGEDRVLALEVTRGLPDNVTTEMDLALWEAATAIRSDDETVSFFRQSDASLLASSYLSGELPPVAQAAVMKFLDQYGMRGVGEIDIGQPRWREDPKPLMETLKSYLEISAELAPDILFRKGEVAAAEAIEKLAGIARRQRAGWLKAKLVHGAARRVRTLMGARESPKFFAIRVMGVIRAALLEAGTQFVELGVIEQPDDLFYLNISELERLSKKEPRDLKALVANHRSTYEREIRRAQVPRVLVSDGRAYYEGIGAGTDNAHTITGSPVSPGVVEGRVRVVLDPRTSQLLPGEIMVCPGTDPAWTPLFMTASGLVTEVGGMMTHGSVVAREYGIPAVVGVHQATQRLLDGQRVCLDGTAGVIMILSDDESK